VDASEKSACEDLFARIASNDGTVSLASQDVNAINTSLDVADWNA
jgi:hypothetical protein